MSTADLPSPVLDGVQGEVRSASDPLPWLDAEARSDGLAFGHKIGAPTDVMDHVGNGMPVLRWKPS